MLGQVLFKEGRVDDAISTLEKSVKNARETQSRLRMPEAFCSRSAKSTAREEGHGEGHR